MVLFVRIEGVLSIRIPAPWGNMAPEDPQIRTPTAMTTVTYSCVEGGYVGEGNIDEDPEFVDPGNDDFHIQTSSPCLNAGTSNAPELPPFDFEGDDRIICGQDKVDMGADESVLCRPFIRGDGNGSGLVDIADPIYNLTFQHLMGPVLCAKALDTNDDGMVNIADPIYNLSYQFSSGPPPPLPFPDCGQDPTADSLGCLGIPVCP